MALVVALGPLLAAAERPSPERLDQRPADGEQCIVCRQQIHQGEVVEVRYKGRTFFVAAKMLEAFETDPDAHFAALQARSGLFDEAALETPPMKTGWLFVGLYILIGLAAGAACSYLALERGLAAWRWFFAGLLLNLLALAAVLTRRRRAAAGVGLVPSGLAKIPTTFSPLACGHCGTANHPAAAACGGCGQNLEPSVEPETVRA